MEIAYASPLGHPPQHLKRFQPVNLQSFSLQQNVVVQQTESDQKMFERRTKPVERDEDFTRWTRDSLCLVQDAFDVSLITYEINHPGCIDDRLIAAAFQWHRLRVSLNQGKTAPHSGI